MFPVVSIVGWHNTGKTTVVEELVKALKSRGLNVATIKHAHLAPSLDQPGTDTHRYAEAGSDLVGLVSHHLTTYAFATDGREDLADVLANVPENTDIAIVEGYKRSTLPKIEVCLAGRPEPIAEGADLLAVSERGDAPYNAIDELISRLEERGLIQGPGYN